MRARRSTSWTALVDHALIRRRDGVAGDRGSHASGSFASTRRAPGDAVRPTRSRAGTLSCSSPSREQPDVSFAATTSWTGRHAEPPSSTTSVRASASGSSPASRRSALRLAFAVYPLWRLRGHTTEARRGSNEVSGSRILPSGSGRRAVPRRHALRTSRRRAGAHVSRRGTRAVAGRSERSQGVAVVADGLGAVAAAARRQRCAREWSTDAESAPAEARATTAGVVGVAPQSRQPRAHLDDEHRRARAFAGDARGLPQAGRPRAWPLR